MSTHLSTIDVAKLPLLEALSPAAQAAIAGLLTTRRVCAGAFVFEQDSPANAVYVLRSGEAEVVKHAHGRDLVLHHLAAGTALGGIGVLEGRPHATTVKAVTDCELVVIPAEFIGVARELDPVGLGEIYRRMFETTAELLRCADVATVGYFSEVLAKREQDEQERDLRHLLVHDLRSPLAICEAGIAQLLDNCDRMGPLTPKQERALKRSRRSAVFMRGLIDEILEVARTDGGAAHVVTVPLREVLFDALTQGLGAVQGLDLDDVAPGDFDGLVRKLATRDVHIEADPKILARALEIDRFRIIQVIMNLISNATKHAPGWLAVRVRDAGQQLVLSVVDRGGGIPVHLRGAVFERYRQVELKNQGVHRGFGLGLAGAARLVEALAGSIAVCDGDGGVGTTMVVHIPWSACPSAPPTGQPARS